jgi:PhoD-like phosphatase
MPMKIIFTSCTNAEHVTAQAIWDEIERRSPDVLMLLGDNIYMDWGDLGESNLKADAATVEGLRDYAISMHSRYKAQWAIANFRQCIRSLHTRNAQIFLTWDDHDFAWNNSFRQGSVDAKHSVPRKVMDVSKRLFEQFKRVLTTPDYSDFYPTMPANWDTSFATDAQGTELTSTFHCQGADIRFQIPFHLLDTRWYRSNRKKENSPSYQRTILGENSQQSASLMRAIAEPNGLLIVAAGSPLFHTGSIGNDYWASKDRLPNYPEYDSLLKNAKRPVLYLSGDIHNNNFSGNLQIKKGENYATPPSQVIQILASGAAIKGYFPCFSELVLRPETVTAGSVDVTLLHLKSGAWKNKPTVPTLKYTANRWVEFYSALSEQQ